MAGSVTVFGGTGFIGRHLVALLVLSGEAVRLALRQLGLTPSRLCSDND
jgi:uncharacterized protein YbjT (DUF2867 family)